MAMSSPAALSTFKQRFLRLNAALLEEWLLGAAQKLHELIPGPPTMGFLIFSIGGKKIMASVEVKDDVAPGSASVRFLDAEGYETPADDTPTWTSSDESVATVTASEDGMSAEIAIGGPGVALIEVSSVEANTGAEVKAQGTITVTPGDAVLGEVSFDFSSPTPAPEPTP